MTGEHVDAVAQAYALIEAAQGELDPGQIDAAAARIGRPEWWDVQVLLHFARSLATREAGDDDSGHVRAMLDMAAALDDPALLALAFAVSAARKVETPRPLDLNESAASPLVRAAVLLDEEGSPVVHRAAALIEVACVAHALGLWELALEHYDRTREALDGDGDPRWQSTTDRQRTVLAVNRIELLLDWAAAEAMVGDWPAAATRAAAAIPGSREVIGPGWPRTWVRQYDGHLHLLAALAGTPPGEGEVVPGEVVPGEVVPGEVVPGEGEVVPEIRALGAAIRAARAADTERAALAQGLADRFRHTVPLHVWLLALQIAGRQRGAGPAGRFADELVLLRWNDRLVRMSSVRDAIAVERRRREHEQLQREIVTDHLTGLANRRGYHAYLTTVQSASEPELSISKAAPPHGKDKPQYAVMMIDVDKFKQVNDQFGHDVGDQVLACIAAILSANVRPVDLAARLGGDEFVVILAKVQPGVSQGRAQAILDAVRDYPWDEVAGGLRVSISVGLHHGGPQELPTLLGDADRHLYQAKSEGRSRVATG
jgi:diguanylate cyclase (GGDEF)-like protein